MRKVSIPLILCFALFSGSKVHAQFAATPRIRNNIIHTYAGGGPDGVPALSANIPVPTAVATDFAGNIYIAAPWGDRIFVVDTAGKIRVVAGSGGPATSASLNLPGEIAFDTNGNLFIADSQNGRIRRVDASTGMITTVAGNGGFTFSGDGGPATAAALNHPGGVAVDTNGNVFIADAYNCRVRRVDAATGIITTVAAHGQFSFSGDEGPATAAELWVPTGGRVGG